MEIVNPGASVRPETASECMRELIAYAVALGWRPQSDAPEMSDEEREQPTVRPGGDS